jgi:hypothetical protein
VREPIQWPWSAHGALVGLAEPAGGIDVRGALEWFASSTGAARIAYQQLVAPSEDGLLDEWERSEPDTWIATAVDDFCVPIGELATRLGVHPVTASRRLAAARSRRAS